MELFVLDDRIADWEAELPALAGNARLNVLLPLAWHLRQRNTLRALELADEADALLQQSSLFAGEQQSAVARLLLVRAEANWLVADLDLASALADEALAMYRELGDAAGMADAHWLRSCIAIDRGDIACSAEELARMAELARPVDSLRAEVADAAMGRNLVFQDARLGEAQWAQRLDPAAPGLHPGSAAWYYDFHGSLAFQLTDFGRAATCWIQTYEHALRSGQVRRAIIAATNIGGAFDSLFDRETGLDWMQRGLDLARLTNWPSAIGLCLIQTADTERLLGHYDSSQELLQEALATLRGLTGSRSYAMALTYMGDLALARGRNEEALANFTELEERGRALQQTDFRIEAARGSAHALSNLGRTDEALEAAHAALALANEQQNAYRQIGALEVLANIHARHALPPPDGAQAVSAPLHYLQTAVEIARSIEGYSVSGELLDAMARAYADAGDFAAAYRVSREANAARNKTNTQEANQRAVALQVKYKTERAQAEGEHLRQMAAEEAKRAEVLAQTLGTLERLGAIGQEITQHLHASSIFETLDRHVHSLLDAPFFAIYLITPDGSAVERPFGIENGEMLASERIELAGSQTNVARCLRERRELLVEVDPADSDPFLIPGTRLTPTKLFAPMIVADRVLGVMSIQSWEQHAYADRERMIFRTLCAYSAIAFDNAAAYRQLHDTQRQLEAKNGELEVAYRALEEVSLTDPLTGLHNRRFLLQHVEGDIALTLRRHEDALAAGQPAEGADVVFFVIDFDQFKSVNDQYGHASGDLVLVQMAQRLRSLFRESDYLVRWGGEEFLVVARATNRAEAEAVAERIRAAVACEPFDLADGSTLSKSCSIGFATYPFFPSQPRVLSWSQVLEIADQSLYMAKNGGRNQWIGLHGIQCSQPDGVFQRLMRQTIKSVQDGEVRLVSSSL